MPIDNLSEFRRNLIAQNKPEQEDSLSEFRKKLIYGESETVSVEASEDNDLMQRIKAAQTKDVSVLPTGNSSIEKRYAPPSYQYASVVQLEKQKEKTNPGIKNNVGAFLESFGEGTGVTRIGDKLTNAFTKPVEETLREELPDAANRYVAQDDRFGNVNPNVKIAGQFTGQLTKELGYAAAGQGITRAALTKAPWLLKAIEKTPNLVQALLKGGISGANVWGLRQAIEPEENKPGLKGLAPSVAMWSGGAAGGQMMSKALDMLAPQLSKIPGLVNVVKTPNGSQTLEVNKVFEGVLSEATENIFGTIAALPTVSDEEKQQFIQDFGPDLLAEGIVDVLTNIVTPGSTKVTDLDIIKSRIDNHEFLNGTMVPGNIGRQVIAQEQSQPIQLPQQTITPQNTIDQLSESGTIDVQSEFKKVTPEEFIPDRDNNKRQQYLSATSTEDMKDWEIYKTDDSVGYALTDEKDMVNVFNNSSRKGAGKEAVIDAIKNGARTCDCFDGFLADYYPRFGFKEKNRVKWDDQYAPEGWDYENDGRPDIVYFEYPEELSRDSADVRTRFEATRSKETSGRVGDSVRPSINAEDAQRTRRGMDQAEQAPTSERTGNVSELLGPSQNKETVSSSVTIPIDERNYENVSSRKVKAYQYEHPEVKDHIQAEAVRIIAELGDTVKGERFYTKGPDGIVPTGTKKLTSETIQRIQDATKASYGEIEKALQSIVTDEGAENTALAKKIELIIDDNLTNGAKDIRGHFIESDEEYVLKKQQYKRSGESDIISSNEKPSPIPGRDRSGTSSQSSLSKLDETIKQTEIEAATVTERNLKDVGPKLGLVNNPLPRSPKTKRLEAGYSFSDIEMEKEWRKSHGITKPSVVEKVKDFLTDLKHKATREYVHLPRTAEFAQIRNDLLKLAKQKNVSGDRAVRFLQSELVRLDHKSMGLFERSVLINDLAAEAEKDNPSLPPGFTPDKVFSEKRLKDQQIGDNLRVKEALKLRKKINDSIIADYIQAMDAVGFDVKDKFKNDSYFRHQVLEYANVKGLVGAGKKLKTPVNRGTLKHRSGYGGSINTNYLEAEYEVLAQMLEDIEIAKTIKSVQENYDISDKVKAEAKKQDLDDWHDAVPEGYVSWQPRQGNAFFMVDSIPAKLASQLNEGLLEEIGVTQNDLRRALAVGGLRKEFVIKEEVAKTLDELVTPKADGLLKQFRKTITAAWKVNALFNPRRLIKYNLRNISSDGEWTAIGNPRAFSKTPQATKELFEVILRNKPMAPEFREWFQRGGMESTLYVQELGDLNKLKVFEHLFKKYPDITKVPKNVWERYWKTAGTLTQFREAILRYSNYLEYLDQMQSNKEGKPKNFGASIPEEVMAIKDIRDRAFWMSNDLSGAYDRVSALGQEIRSQVYPFWSFVEINFKRYIQFAKNQARDGRLAGAVGKHFIRTAPRVAYGVGKFAIKATAFWSMLQAYNYLLFRDEEEELPPDTQSRPHIIFGRDKDGKIKYFDRLGSLGDFLEWFGLDEAPGLVKDFLNGRRNIREIAVEMAKSPVNKVVGGMSPFYKLLPEVLMKKQLYPDAFKPSRIRDLGVYLAKQFGLENEYKEVMGLPTRGYGKTAEGAAWYSVEPKESAYYAILDEKQRYQKKVGKYQEGYSENERSNALYNLKLAMRYGDKRATDKYLQLYVEKGGNTKGFDRSMKSLDPLYGLGKNEKAFIESLNPEQKKQLEMAQQFYEEIVAGKKELKNEIIKLKKAAN